MTNSPVIELSISANSQALEKMEEINQTVEVNGRTYKLIEPSERVENTFKRAINWVSSKPGVTLAVGFAAGATVAAASCFIALAVFFANVFRR